MLHINDPYDFGTGLGRFFSRINPELNSKELGEIARNFLELVSTDLNPNDYAQRDSFMQGVGYGFSFEKNQ